MAKGKTPEPPQIQAKSLGQIQQEAITANIESLPRILEAYKQYGPQFVQAMTENYSQAQSKARNIYPELYKVLDPLGGAVSSKLSKLQTFFNTGDASAIPDYILNPYRENLRAAQAGRGTFNSPVSAYQEANFLLPYTEQYGNTAIDQGVNVAELLNRIKDVPGSVGPEDIGLGIPSIGEGINTEANILQPFRETARIENYNTNLAYQQNKNKQKNRALGYGIGAMVGGGIGLAGGPIGALQGAKVGGEVGGTFF